MKILSTTLAAVGLVNLASGSPASRLEARFSYKNEMVRGVSLGGWLVSEPWITPSLYAQWNRAGPVHDEFTLCEHLPKHEAKSRLEAHWSSFIGPGDFHQIKAAGMNHVRIPVGHWSVIPIPSEPYVQGAYEYLRRALDWAREAGLNVLIDVHTAPGSQNGFDNSGRLGPIEWMSFPGGVDHSLQVIQKLVDDFGQHPALSSIELLNEPAGGVLDRERLRQFYRDGYQLVKSKSKEDMSIAISDAFLGPHSWNGFENQNDGWLVDTHNYHVFGDFVARPVSEHVTAACGFRGNMNSAGSKPIVAGEWSAALTDCALWLNGLRKGSRYDGTLAGVGRVGACDGRQSGRVQDLPKDVRDNMRRFIEAQLDAYETGRGWIFWTWKTEGAPEWDMRDLLSSGVFPQPLNDRKFAGQCGF